jgi:hypothetical protein
MKADSFLYIVVFVLVALLLADRFDHNTDMKPTVVRDTLWVRHDSIVLSKPKLIYSIGPVSTKLIKEIQYVPDTNYNVLLKQYQALLILYLNKNIIVDTLKLEKFGYVSITDTLHKNLVASRKYNYHIKYPEITEKITLHPRQFFIGGGLQGNKIDLVNQINLGVLYKNKKDQIFGASVGLSRIGSVEYNINYYTKIKIK